MAEPPWRDWVGRTEVRDDRVSVTAARAMAATLDRADLADLGPGDALPPLWLWGRFQAPAATSALGPDGHPRRGAGVLPPIPSPRRMWAGGRCRFHATIRIGDALRRTSTLLRVEEKAGGAGPMVLATVRHAVARDGELLLEEEQDLVFLEAPHRHAPPAPTPAPPGDWREAVAMSPVLLFRYSALTFNAHRIHYDRTYAVEVERYPGLVVHGPLQATLLFDAACRRAPDRTPAAFRFRGLRPLFDVGAVDLNGRACGRDGVELFTTDGGGAVGLRASLDWRPGVTPGMTPEASPRAGWLRPP